MLDAKRRNEYASLINDSGNHLLAVINGILDMSKIETDNFEITPEPFAPAQVVAACCGLFALRAREAGVGSRKWRATIAGNDRRQAGAEPNSAQSRIERDPLYRALRQGHGRRPGRAGTSSSWSRTTASASATKIWRGSASPISRPAPATTADTAVPVWGIARQGLGRLHGGDLHIRSRIGEGTRVTVELPLDCERARPMKKAAKPAVDLPPSADHLVDDIGTNGLRRGPILS